MFNQFTQHHVVNIGARQLAMQRSVLVVKLQLGPLHFPYLITWHFGQKNPMGPRVFWFKADDFGSVLLPGADLLRMVFFGVFWIWIGLRC